MQGSLSLRARVVVLIAAILLPMAGLALWASLRETRTSTQLAQSQLLLAATLLAANQDRAVESAEQMLGAIAFKPGLPQVRTDRCDAYFRQLQQRYPVYNNIGYATADGLTVCDSAGSAGRVHIIDRAYAQTALRTHRFVMGEALVGRHTGRRGIPFGMPVMRDGAAVGLVFAILDIDRAAASLSNVPLPPQARVIVTDARGQVLMVFPRDDAEAVRRRAPLRAPSGSTQVTAGEHFDQATQELRIHALARSRPVGDEHFVVRVGMPRDVITAGAVQHERNVLAALVAAVLLALGTAWWLGSRFIVRPARQILGAVRRIEEGSLDVRVQSPLLRRGEFARIAAAFNTMAQSLQLRQMDLHAELQRSKNAYGLLDIVINGMQEALVAVTPTGEFLMWNAAASRMFPLEGGMLPAREWGDRLGILHADGVTPCLHDELPLVRSTRGDRGDAAFIIRNEVVPRGRTVHCSWQPISGSGGPIGGLVVFADMTDVYRLQAEQALQFAQLRETQRKLVEAQRIGRVGNWEFDLRTGRVWWSDEVYVLFGLRRDEFDGTIDGFLARVHADDRNKFLAARDAGFGGEGPIHIEYRVLRGDGTLAWMHAIAEPRRDERGQPGWFGGVVQDVTERRMQEEALRASQAELREMNASLEQRIAERTSALARQERLYRSLAEQAPEIVWNTDATGAVTYLNRRWYELVGGTPEDWLGTGWLERVHPDDVAEVVANWAQSRKTHQPYSGTRRIQARDGSWHTMSYRAAPIFDEHGVVLSWSGIDADITSLKAIENALRASNQELEAFSYSVSHDLRAPLGAIGGFTEALSAHLHGMPDERARHYLGRIAAGVGKMEQLIEAMLSLSQVVRAPLHWGEVNLGAIAHETVEALRMREPGREVQVDVAPGLRAHGDQRLLRIVLENLIGNAWKFTAHAHPARIEIGCGEPGAYYVRDNGVGFEMTYASKLFTAFQRLHADTEFAGTGVGLATVRRIVVRHQGRVWAESQPGRGTTFRFTLPGGTEPPPWLTGAD